MSFNDMFKAEDIKALEKADQELNQKLDFTGDCARKCLRLEVFKTYKKSYEEAEKKMLAVMLMCTESYIKGSFDLSIYGSKMLVYMTRLKDLKTLVDAVTLDSKKGKVDGPDNS